MATPSSTPRDRHLVRDLSRCRWSPATTGPPGPSMASFLAVDGPPGPTMAAMNGPLCCKWSPQFFCYKYLLYQMLREICVPVSNTLDWMPARGILSRDMKSYIINAHRVPRGKCS